MTLNRDHSLRFIRTPVWSFIYPVVFVSTHERRGWVFMPSGSGSSHPVLPIPVSRIRTVGSRIQITAHTRNKLLKTQHPTPKRRCFERNTNCSLGLSIINPLPLHHYFFYHFSSMCPMEPTTLPHWEKLRSI